MDQSAAARHQAAAQLIASLREIEKLSGPVRLRSVRAEDCDLGRGPTWRRQRRGEH